MYAEAAAGVAAKKAGKAAKRAEAATAKSEAIMASQAAYADEAAPGQKRKVGRDIEANRGLTRQRKKLDRNPRVKNKEKFRRAGIRRKGQVRDVTEQSGAAYAGESSGIKKNVSHSKRFK